MVRRERTSERGRRKSSSCQHLDDSGDARVLVDRGEQLTAVRGDGANVDAEKLAVENGGSEPIMPSRAPAGDKPRRGHSDCMHPP